MTQEQMSEYLTPKIIRSDDGQFFASIKFCKNEDMPTALKILVNAIWAAGYHERRHNFKLYFKLEAINNKGFVDPGSISVTWKGGGMGDGFDRMYDEYVEWSKTHKALECVVSSDFFEVWMDAYRSGQKAEREITEKRMKSLYKTILDADSWLHIGEGVHLDYYHKGYGDDESVAIIEELLRSNNIIN